jgi:hypothetical protein
MFTAFDTFGSEKRYIAADFERLPFYCALFVYFVRDVCFWGKSAAREKQKCGSETSPATNECREKVE